VYPDGLNVQGRFGDQVMYSLTDGRVMYVPPVVRDKLVELGIHQHEPFAICRAERREGNRRFVDWVVQPEGSAAATQSATAHRDTSGSQADGGSGARVKPNGNGNANGKSASAPTNSGTAETALRAALTGEHRRSPCSGTVRVRAWALDPFRQRTPACPGAQPVHPARP
jgi:hypothetical protein